MSKKLVATLVAVLLTATPLALLTSSPASAQTYNVVTASVITVTDLNFFTENPDLAFVVNPTDATTLAGTMIMGCLNGDCGDGETGRGFGALHLIGQNAACEEGTPGPWCRALGYCVEAAVPVNLTNNPFGAFTFDAKATYLAWKYSADFHGGYIEKGGNPNSAPENQNVYQSMTGANGNTGPVYAAAQVLIWKWVSDANGSTVWANHDTANAVSDAGTGFSVDTTTSPAVDPDGPIDTWLNNNDNLGGAYLYEDDPAALMAAANQAILTLEAEATAKQGPWTVADSADYSGIVITGSAGPIYGETITFSDNSTAVTNANGYVAWPDGVTELNFERPGVTYLGVGTENSQDIMLAFGEAVNVTRPVVEVVPDPTPTPEPIAVTDEEPEEELPFVGSERTPLQVAVVLVLAGLGVITTASVLRRN
ncbi:MAG: hypothetical protein ACJ0F6_01460 [Acidimicrobiales bacterium]